MCTCKENGYIYSEVDPDWGEYLRRGFYSAEWEDIRVLLCVHVVDFSCYEFNILQLI